MQFRNGADFCCDYSPGRRCPAADHQRMSQQSRFDKWQSAGQFPAAATNFQLAGHLRKTGSYAVPAIIPKGPGGIQMRPALLTLTTLLFLVPAGADAAKPIMNMVDVAVPTRSDGSTYTAEEVQAVIIQGCHARGWSAVVDDAGLIRASITVRGRHFAEVEIPYDASAYSINYLSSNNLDYNEKKQRIHRNYNNWVVKLSGTIDKYLRRPVPIPAATKTGQASADQNGRSDIYSEILKLDDLRNRGLLTDEEFEAEKRKLLSKE